jgi:hypothetical protein
MIFGSVGAWRSLVAHLLWEQRVGGSNPSAPTICYWVHSGDIDDAHTSLDLTDAATAATPCRAIAYQEGERAKKTENPGMRRPIENTQMRLRTL